MSHLARLARHAVLLAAVAGVLALIYPQLLGRAPVVPIANRDAAFAAPAAGAAPASTDIMAAAGLTAENDDFDFAVPVQPSTLLLSSDGSVFRSPQLQTIIPKRPRKELVIHTVASGDNLSTLAERYDVDVDTLIWANAELEEDPDYLVVDQKLVIPPVSGVLYTVKTGDTLEGVAKTYKGDLRTMVELEFNKLSEPATIPISGTQIMIPGGETAYQPRLVYIGGQAVMVNAPRGAGRFVWPTQGYITTFFGDGGHAGIDIAAPLGTPIYAADAGIVIFAGWNGGYGNCVIIDHGNGYQTLYGHLSAYYPRQGQNVRRGQAIGKMGSTGNSTGSHLHFEIRYQGGVVNPLRYLPQ